MEYSTAKVSFKSGLKVQSKFVRKKRSVCKGTGVFKKCMASFEESSCVVWLISGVYEGAASLKRWFLIDLRWGALGWQTPGWAAKAKSVNLTAASSAGP